MFCGAGCIGLGRSPKLTRYGLFPTRGDTTLLTKSAVLKQSA